MLQAWPEFGLTAKMYMIHTACCSVMRRQQSVYSVTTGDTKLSAADITVAILENCIKLDFLELFRFMPKIVSLYSALGQMEPHCREL